MSEDERAIRAVVATWIEASNAGDLAAILDLMTDDVVFLVPGSEFGKAEFAAAAAEMKDVAIDAASVIQEVQVLGGWAFLRAQMSVTMTPPGAKPSQRGGRTLTILKKGEDGRWRVARDANFVLPVET